MKTIHTLFATLFFFFISLPVFSQGLGIQHVSAIEPYRLTIGLTKTTHLVFPYAIKSVDKGSRDVLVQKAKEVENILQVKAAIEDFKETNLTVITADGKLYSFLLNFDADPAVLNLVFDQRSTSVPAIIEGSHNEAKLKKYADSVALEPRTFSGKKDSKYGIELRLDGFFIQEDVIYCRIRIENGSPISYDIDQVRFFIRDRKRAKRSASQEIEISPLYTANELMNVKELTEQTRVYALPKFMISDQKYLIVQLMEKNGGRHLELKINPKTLFRSWNL